MKLRKIRRSDKEKYIEMAVSFYNSEAVDHTVKSSNFEEAFNEIMRSDLYAECYIIEENLDIAGYILISKTFSQEAGGMCVWIEEVWIEPRFRGLGIGKSALQEVIKMNENTARFRLEYSSSNASVSKLYGKLGFNDLDYRQMYMDK